MRALTVLTNAVRTRLLVLKVLSVLAGLAFMYVCNFVIVDRQRVLVNGTDVRLSHLLAFIATVCFTVCLLVLSVGNDAVHSQPSGMAIGQFLIFAPTATFFAVFGVGTLIFSAVQAHAIW